jgi:hypothetical protein
MQITFLIFSFVNVQNGVILGRHVISAFTEVAGEAATSTPVLDKFYMSYLSYAQSLLGDLHGRGVISQSAFHHATNLASIVKERGGTEKDLSLCLLHEIPDLAPDALVHLDEDFRNSLLALSEAMPDFLRHSDDQIIARTKTLLAARRPVHVIWMCDVQESMSNERLRLAVPDSPEERRSLLLERVTGAIALLDHFKHYKPLALFMDAVRSEAVRVTTLVRRDELQPENGSDAGTHAPCH